MSEIIGGVTSIAVAPSPATTGTSLTVTSGESAALGPGVATSNYFHAAICPNGAVPIFKGPNRNAEIVLVTANSAEVFTIVRAQAGTTARTVIVGDQIYPVDIAQISKEAAINPSGSGTSWLYQKRSGDYNQMVGFQFGLTVADKVTNSAPDVTNMSLFGFVENAATDGAGHQTVGVGGAGRATANGANVYGANFIAINGGVTDPILTGVEVDILGYPAKTDSASSRGVAVITFESVGGTALYVASSDIATGNFAIGLELSGIGTTGTAIEVDPNISLAKGLDMSGPTFSGQSLLAQNATFSAKSGSDLIVVLNTVSTNKNPQIQWAENSTVLWKLYNDGSGGTNRIGFYDNANSQVTMQLDPGTPAANTTAMRLQENGGLRQVKWKAGNALGVGDKVMVLV